MCAPGRKQQTMHAHDPIDLLNVYRSRALLVPLLSKLPGLADSPSLAGARRCAGFLRPTQHRWFAWPCARRTGQPVQPALPTHLSALRRELHRPASLVVPPAMKASAQSRQFGVILVLWDRLFGTLQEVPDGLTTPMGVTIRRARRSSACWPPCSKKRSRLRTCRVRRCHSKLACRSRPRGAGHQPPPATDLRRLCRVHRDCGGRRAKGAGQRAQRRA